MSERKQTPWAVICREHGQVFLTNAEYDAQMDDPDAFWKCPICNRSAEWNDDNYEAIARRRRLRRRRDRMTQPDTAREVAERPMDATLAGLVAKAPDVAQPVEEFMYAYQKWLTELEQAIFALPPASEKPAPAGEAKGDRE